MPHDPTQPLPTDRAADPAEADIVMRQDKVIIVHVGEAVVHEVAGKPQVSGPDVILAHRLLKNSVPSQEYLLLSEKAFELLGARLPGRFEAHDEDYGGRCGRSSDSAWPDGACEQPFPMRSWPVASRGSNGRDGRGQRELTTRGARRRRVYAAASSRASRRAWPVAPIAL